MRNGPHQAPSLSEEPGFCPGPVRGPALLVGAPLYGGRLGAPVEGPAHSLSPSVSPSQVEGYSVGCECSPDGDLLVTGSADGRVVLYCFRTASRARTLAGHAQACVGAAFHPVLPSVLASCSWDGDVKIWH